MEHVAAGVGEAHLDDPALALQSMTVSVYSDGKRFVPVGMYSNRFAWTCSELTGSYSTRLAR